MREQTRQFKAIEQQIRQILLQHWDPLEVATVPQAQSEYATYINGIYHLLKAKASKDKIIQYLTEIEAKEMGISPHQAKAEQAAVKLCELSNQI
jgi:hypothetical protein